MNILLGTHSKKPRLQTYFNLLKPETSCTPKFNKQHFCVLPTVHLCILRESQNKERLCLFTVLTYRFLQARQRVFTAPYELGL